jgi:pimeloyl-ACP methyl ester carboxylesterase
VNGEPDQQIASSNEARMGLEMAWVYRAIITLGIAAIIGLGILIDPWLWPSRLRICGIISAALLVLAIQPTLIASLFLARKMTSPRLPADVAIGLLAGLKTYDREIDASLRGLMWGNPFLARRPAPALSGSAQPVAVLFLHGYFCNRGVWLPTMKVIAAHGYAVEAITLEPAFGAIEDYSQAIGAAISELLTQSFATRVVLVGHSMGAIAARFYLEQQQDARVERLVCIGAPHHGTIAAAFGRSRNARQIRRDSFWLDSLNASTNFPRERVFNIYSAHDDVGFPYGTSHLEGAENRQLHGIGHVSLLYHDEVRKLLLECLRSSSEPSQ